MSSAYPAYRPSGIDWLGDIPKHWEVKRLKQIVSAKITDGPHTTPEFVDDGIPFVSAQAINDNRINFENIRGYISEEDHLEFSKKVKPQRNDIFIVKSGATTGRVACVETDLEFNIWSPLAVVRCQPHRAFYRFVFQQLQSRVFQAQIEYGWSYGTQENIGMGVIERLFLSIPPISEQTAIADYLDRFTAGIDQLIRNKEAQMERLRELRQIEITNAVTKGLDPTVPMRPSGVEWLGEIPEHWEVKRLKDHVLSNVESLGKETDPDMEIQYIDISNVDDKGFTGEVQELQYFEAPSRARRVVRNGDVLMSTVRPNLKAIAYIVEATPNLIASTGFAVLSVRKSYDARFLYYVLMSHWFNETVCANSVGANYPSVNVNVLVALKVVAPPLDEQVRIAEHLTVTTSKIDQTIETLEAEIARLRELRQVTIYNAVTGKVKVA